MELLLTYNIIVRTGHKAEKLEIFKHANITILDIAGREDRQDHFLRTDSVFGDIRDDTDTGKCDVASACTGGGGGGAY